MGARYHRGQNVNSSYACDTKLAISCKGTVATGAPFSTSTLGSHTFEVTMVVSTQGYAGIQKPITVDVRYTVVK